jgi:hypothetical protein
MDTYYEFFPRSLKFKRIHQGIVLLLTVLIAWHAWRMEITNDEAYSFFLLKTNYLRALVATANTHWLNSLFMKIFSTLLGNAPFCLRIQSIIAFPFFAYGIFQVSSFVKIPIFRRFFYFIVLFNPYLLDYFALARGYGMALCFSVWMVVYLQRALSLPSFSFGIWTRVWGCALLTLASNFSWLYMVMGVTLLFCMQFFSSRPGYSISLRLPRRVAIMFLALICFTGLELLLIKFYGHDLNYGGDTGFFASVFGSVWNGTFYFSTYRHLSTLIAYVSCIFMLLSMLYFGYKYYLIPSWNMGQILMFLLATIFICNLFFHIVSDTPYFLYRTAIQWFPLGILLISICLSELTAKLKITVISFGILSILGCILIITHFFLQFDPRYCYEYRNQAEAKECFKDLVAVHPVKPAIHKYLFGVFMNYYRITDTEFAKLQPAYFDEGNQNRLGSASSSLRNFDYVLLVNPKTLKNLQHIHTRYRMLKKYTLTGDMLIHIMP